MGVHDRATPPTEWCDWWTEVHQLTPNIAYGWVPPELNAEPQDPNPWFWHWCPPSGRWECQAAPEHTLVSREPLHLEPSLLWRCCNTHGFVRNGEWINA
ncbi:hypothetical protein ACWERY_16390 [Streptomyces sp. NPDC004082]